MHKDSLLELQNVALRFGGLTAVDDVSFSVTEGEIFSVIGPNGAGKTSLFNVITGVYTPSSGAILFKGHPTERTWSVAVLVRWITIGLSTGLFLAVLTNIQTLWQVAVVDNYIYQQPFPWWQAMAAGIGAILSAPFGDFILPFAGATFLGTCGAASMWQRSRRTPEVVSRSGMARTFQNIRLFDGMTVLENVLVGMDTHIETSLAGAALSSPRVRRVDREAVARAREILQFVHLEEKEHELADNLSYGYRRRLEIARALATQPSLLLLDEPAAGMNPSESGELMELIQRIRARGITVLLIEHHMKVVMGISDRIVVLQYGKKIADGTPEEIMGNRQVIEAYLGEEEAHHD